MEETFFRPDSGLGRKIFGDKKNLGWKWDETTQTLLPMLFWEKKYFEISSDHLRLGQWDQFERVDFLHRLCRLFYHDINGKITGFDGMIQLWKFRFPDEVSFKEDLNLLEQSVHHLKKLNLLMDAGTDLGKLSEFNIEHATSLLDGLTQRALGISEPIKVSGLSTIKGAAGYTLFLIWSFIVQVASLSTSRTNWRIVLGSGQRLNRDLELCIQSEGLPHVIEVLEGIPQRSRLNRWLMMRLAAGDIVESTENEWSFSFNVEMKESLVDQYVIGSDLWMSEVFKSSLIEKRPQISEEKMTDSLIQKTIEMIF